jgi:protein-glutamine gamma-glutamyltransferase
MSATPPRPMTLDRLLWAAGVVIGASLPHWSELEAWIPALLGISVAWRIGAMVSGWPLPSRILRMAFAVAAFAAILLQYRTINGVTAGSALLVVMVALKFLELHSQRDQLVLIIISYFLVFAGLLYHEGLLSGFYLLAFVWITTVGLLQLGRRGTLLPSLPTAKLAGRLLLQSVPIMLVLFLLFPRLPGPLWGIPRAESAATTGLSETMSPGDITDLGLSEEVAFRAEFFSPPPRADALYWRGPVLSEFNGRTWSRSPGMGRDVRSSLEYLGEPTDYRVMLEPSGQRWALALDMPGQWSGVRNLTMGSDYQLRMFFAEPLESRIDYRVKSYADYRAREPLTPAERERFSRLPEDSNPRTRALIAGWLAEDANPRRIIARALEYFRHDTFFYTLTPPALGRHTADEFIFETREGFCEHYASAFAIMMRAAGIPTRIVTGYQGGELNGIGRYYIIRQADAHAWTEVWLEDDGWVRIDPVTAVAPERIVFGSPRALESEAIAGARGTSWIRTAMFAWDAVNTYWSDWVIGYGPAMQRALLRGLGFERPQWAHLMTLATGATAAILVALMLYLSWRFRRRRRRDPAARMFSRFASKLTRRRVAERAPTESPVAYARRAATMLPGSAGEIDAIVAAYLAARYEPDADRRELGRLRALVKEFRPA